MNADSLLSELAEIFAKHSFEAILIGNAAAALHGAPVTTVDLDFMFRKTPQNLSKLKKIAKELGAVILRPYYPVSALYRVTTDRRNIQLDFMPTIHGVKSFASLRSRAEEVDFDGFKMQVASLSDIIKSKRSANRKRDLLVLDILEKVLREKDKEKKPKK